MTFYSVVIPATIVSSPQCARRVNANLDAMRYHYVLLRVITIRESNIIGTLIDFTIGVCLVSVRVCRVDSSNQHVLVTLCSQV